MDRPTKIRWGVLGYAKIAREKMLPAMGRSTNAEFFALASRDQQKLTQAKASFSVPHLHETYEALLADAEVDAVYIPLPNALHTEWSIKALEQGKHVLCEKPIALNIADCRRMTAAAKASGRLLMEGFMYRYTERTKRVRQIVADGILGELRSISSSFRIAMPPEGSIKHRPELGGGAIYDVGCYPIDFVGLFTSERPSAVAVQGHIAAGIDVEASVLLRYPSGLIATLHTGFNAGRWVSAEIVGTKGVLIVPDTFLDEGGFLTLSTAEGTSQIPIPPGDRFKGEIEDFSAAILAGRAPAISLEDSLRGMELIDRIRGELFAGRKA